MTGGAPPIVDGAAARAAWPDAAADAAAPHDGARGAAPLIELHGAGVAFGHGAAAVQALRDVTLTLHRGERVALVGANGAGKTTLLRLLNGLVAPTAGTRTLHGRPRVAMVFQRPFWLHFSVQRNLRLALWLAGVPRAERDARVAAALARVGLEAQRAQSARSLSGGQQQRLALARVGAVRPDVVFLDEPTASLDPGAKREVEALIESFATQGMTVVLSSHNLGQVKRLARRVVFLDHGRLGADAPTAAFFAPPSTSAMPAAARAFLEGEGLG